MRSQQNISVLQQIGVTLLEKIQDHIHLALTGFNMDPIGNEIILQSSRQPFHYYMHSTFNISGET